MRHRSRIDIVGGILEAANEKSGIKSSKIMYKAFLSFAQMKEYLRVLIENNLLRYDAYTQTFKTTEKGLRFLHSYNQMDDMIKQTSEQQ